MEAETLPMDFQNKLEVLFQEVNTTRRMVARPSERESHGTESTNLDPDANSLLPS